MPADNPQVVAAVGGPPSQIIVQPQPTAFGRYGKWMLAALLLMAVALVSVYTKYHNYFSPPGGPQERYYSLSQQAQKKIVVVSVEGVILDGESSFVKSQIDRVRSDKDVVAIVLRIDSPGGSVSGSDYLYHHLRKLIQGKKLTDGRELPMVVSMGGLCASGGYYLAMAVGGVENSIYAEPTTWTGSIGVVIPHYDLSGTIAALRIKDDSIISGPNKLAGSFTREMTPEQRELLQSLVNDSFQGFKTIVTSGRPKFKDDPAALDAVATGQIFAASQARDKGLVDRIGFIEDAIARAAELAGVSASDARCVKYDRPASLFPAIGASASASSDSLLDLSSIFNLTTPRAYYLWSGLPAAIANVRP